jgi:hypothetical protein
MSIKNFHNITTTGFDEDALATLSPNDDIRNFATLTTLGDLANGIFAGADGVSITNFGQIETSGRGAEGILIEGADAHVRNFGSIVTHGEPTDDFLFFNEAIVAIGSNFDLQNWGKLETHGFASQGIVGVGDEGLILNFGAISTSGDSSDGLAAFGNNAQIDNWGVIETKGHFATGMLGFGEGELFRNFGSISTVGQGLLVVGDGNRLVNYGHIHINDPFQLTPSMDVDGSHDEAVNYGTITGGGMFAGGFTPLSGFGNTATNCGTISMDGEDACIVATGHAALAQNFGTLENLATVQFVAGGIAAVGDSGVHALNTGTITTHAVFGRGLDVDTGADGEADNAGSIHTSGDAAAGIIFISSLGGEVTNSGSIETLGGVSSSVAATGVEAFGLDVLVHNTHTASIETRDPASPAIALNVHDIAADSFRPGVIAADTHARLENEGTIIAAQTAVLAGAGDETVVNHGRIVGNVDLGAGDDTFVFAKGGSLVGELFLGSGDNFIRIEKGGGTARIADLSVGDVIDVSAFFSSFKDLQGNSAQHGNDVVINLGHQDQLVLEHVQLNTLNPDFFVV